MEVNISDLQDAYETAQNLKLRCDSEMAWKVGAISDKLYRILHPECAHQKPKYKYGSTQEIR